MPITTDMMSEIQGLSPLSRTTEQKLEQAPKGSYILVYTTPEEPPIVAEWREDSERWKATRRQGHFYDLPTNIWGWLPAPQPE